jgi:poly(3-hydroxyalkanoate) synthetase
MSSQRSFAFGAANLTSQSIAFKEGAKMATNKKKILLKKDLMQFIRLSKRGIKRHVIKELVVRAYVGKFCLRLAEPTSTDIQALLQDLRTVEREVSK